MTEQNIIAPNNIRDAIGMALQKYDGSGDDWIDYGDAMVNVYVEDNELWVVAYPSFDSLGGMEMPDGQVLVKVTL